MTILGHFVRARAPGVWITGMEPAASDWISFDARGAQAVNGDDGGTWAPAAGNPIIINGSGMQVTGPTTIVGAGATLTSLVSGAFRFTSTEWPALGPTHASRSRTLVCSTLRASPSISQVGQSNAYPIMANLAFASAQTVLVPGLALTLVVPLRVHDGADLNSVTVNWIVSWPHTAQTLPRFRVLRINQFGAVTLMSSTNTGADANGYFTAPTAGWSHPGVAQAFKIDVDINNHIDISSFEYVLEIVEEQGVVGFPWTAWCFGQSVNYVDVTGNVSPTGTQTVDGVSVTGASTSTVLLTAQPDPTQNGLWITAAGSWIRAGSIPAAGAIFFVQQGGQLAGTYWQCPFGGAQNVPLWKPSIAYTLGQLAAPLAGASGFGLVGKCTTGGTSNSSEPGWPPSVGLTVTDGTAVWTMQANTEPTLSITPLADPLFLVTGCGEGFAAFGNIWLPITCSLSGISDCRWD